MGELLEVAVSGRPVFFLVPEAVDDPARVSGGNVYDLHLRDGLLADGCDLRMLAVADGGGHAGRILSGLPHGALVLIDGLLVAQHPDAVADQSGRLHVVVLAHMVAPEQDDRERDALRSAELIVATSAWTRSELIARDAADPRSIVVAHPGVDAAPPSEPSATGGRLLCVAAVAPHKGQDLLVSALAGLADIDGWSCTFVGSLATTPEFAAALTARAAASGIAERVTFTGVLAGRALDEAYGQADLVVVPSRVESYGMVAAEAIARGIPVLATGVGGIVEAVGDGRAAMIVPPGDPWALRVALRQWWKDPARRHQLRAAAMDARGASTTWASTAQVVAAALARVPDAASAETAVRS
ncbi:glycosyltransferase family 4 protein [Leifsonia sp. PS1209]|uniref:glycosyltransferase family 4 protein n=1 Tax=Leifsonia sp. PS1209 TaxID=2724914 RepID=UPI001442AF06|nr:glycosyltransferase family 4 protein [Leifsonia sp. PS1209]QIZ97488.1 glycosyltransferase family 4 protein [Leifsonia sp. PS1209]